MLPGVQRRSELPATFEQKRRFGKRVRIDVDERCIALDDGSEQRRLRWIDITEVGNSPRAPVTLADGAGGRMAIPHNIDGAERLFAIVQERLEDAHGWRARRLRVSQTAVPYYQLRKAAILMLVSLVVAAVVTSWFNLLWYGEVMISLLSGLIYVATLPHVVLVSPSGIELRNRLRSTRVGAGALHDLKLLVFAKRGAVIALVLKNGETIELRGYGAGTLGLYDKLRQLVAGTDRFELTPPSIERRLEPRRAMQYAGGCVALLLVLLWMPVLSGRALSEGVRFLPLSTIALLLDWGSAVDRADSSGRTATYNAAKYGRLDVLELLLARGGDPAKRSWNGAGHTPLHVAAEYNELEAVRILLRAGVSPNVLNNWQQTPLMQIALLGHRGPDEAVIVEELLTAGADVNLFDNRGFTVAHMADDRGTEWLLGVIAERGADLNAQVHGSRQRPLDRAILRNVPSIVRALAAAGADLDLPSHHSDESWLAVAVDELDLPLAKLLLECGARTDIASQKGYLPLQHAVWNGASEMTRALIEAGADVNATTQEINSPLRIAVDRGHDELARTLLAAGAKPNVAPDGFTPLQVAADRGNLAMVKILIDGGAYLDAGSSKYPPALTAASYRGHAEVVKLLLSHGASANISYEDWTPLRAALSGNNPDVANLLVAAGAR